ncbi:hypothetical protein Ciccas_004982, partial [Cichlidogyrus casuarinus]
VISKVMEAKPNGLSYLVEQHLALKHSAISREQFTDEKTHGEHRQVIHIQTTGAIVASTAGGIVAAAGIGLLTAKMAFTGAAATLTGAAATSTALQLIVHKQVARPLTAIRVR